MRTCLLVSAVVIAVVGLARGDEAPDRIPRLIAKLGSARFAEREAATHALDRLGAAALDPLRAARQSADAEVRHRAAALVEAIENRLANDRLIAPTLVTLDFRDTPLAQAVGVLRQRTKLDIQLNDAVARRNVTAASKPLPVWEAVELFCRKAELREWDGYTPVPPGFASAPLQTVVQPQFFGGAVIMNRGRITTRPTPGTDGRVMLHDGAGPAVVASHAGAVRVRVLPPGTPYPWTAPTGDDSFVLPLHVSPEAKFTNVHVLSATVEKALDDRGQTLVASDLKPEALPDEQEQLLVGVGQMMMRSVRPRSTQIAVRIRPGEQPSQKLAELRGQLIAEAAVADTLLTTDAKVKVGQTMAGNYGLIAKVLAFEASEAGPKYTVEIDVPPDLILATGRGTIAVPAQNGAFVIRAVNSQLLEQLDTPACLPGTVQYGGLSLEDAHGEKREVVGGIWKRQSAIGRGGRYTIAVTFRPGDLDGVKLTASGTRPATIQVPFAFRDVPLR